MKLLRLNNEYYLIDDELEITIKDWYYVNGHITQSASGEVEKGDYRLCDKVLASTVKLEGLPLIYKNEVDNLVNSYIDVEKLAEDFAKENYHSLNNPASNISGFVNGYNRSLKDNKDKQFTLADMKQCFEQAREKITHPDWDYIHDDFDKFFKSFMNEKNQWGVMVEGTTVSFHSKKWDKLLGRRVPSVNESGYVKITSIYKL